MRTLLLDEVIPNLSGRAYELSQGQTVRIVGRTTVDFVAFNLHDLAERFDQARTKSNHSKIFVSTGDTLFSKRDNVMFTIVEDTYPGHHDLEKGMCSRKRHEMVFRGESKRFMPEGGAPPRNPQRWEDVPARGCWECLSDALAPWHINPDDIPSPFNLFAHKRIDEQGVIWHEQLNLQEDAHIDLRAEMDLLIAATPGPHGQGHPTRVQVYDVTLKFRTG